MTISLPLRALCAVVAVVLFLGGVAGLVAAPSALFLIALFGAGLVAVPAMFGGDKPSADELPRIEEQFHRFRHAALLCFAAAAFVYAFVITFRGRIAHELLQQLASLGVSLWLVAFVLLFFVAYYRSQRRLAAEE